jgi:hypothetical protein
MGGGAAAETGRRRRRPGALASLAAAAACLGLGACAPGRVVGPAAIWREVSGANDAARLPPPGLDRPFPSLGSVPPRPDRPSPEIRDAITAALTADRGRARGEPVALREVPGEGGAPAPVPAGMAAGPPPRPALAAAPRIPWTEDPSLAPPGRRDAAPAVVAPQQQGAPAAPEPAAAPAPVARPPGSPRPGGGSSAPVPAAALPEVPDAAPAPPPPDLLGAPPPLPSPDLLGAPPPPARR